MENSSTSSVKSKESKSRYARLKWVEITARGRSEFKLTQEDVTNPEAQKMSLVRSYTFATTSMSPLNQFLIFLGEYNKNTSGSYSFTPWSDQK